MTNSERSNYTNQQHSPEFDHRPTNVTNAFPSNYIVVKDDKYLNFGKAI